MPSNESHSQVTSYGSSISHSYGESISQSQGWSEGSFLIESGWTGTSRQYDPPPTYTSARVNRARRQLRKAFDDLLDALIASGDLVTWPARTWSRDERRRLLLTLLLSEWA